MYREVASSADLQSEGLLELEGLPLFIQQHIREALDFRLGNLRSPVDCYRRISFDPALRGVFRLDSIPTQDPSMPRLVVGIRFGAGLLDFASPDAWAKWCDDLEHEAKMPPCDEPHLMPFMIALCAPLFFDPPSSWDYQDPGTCLTEALGLGPQTTTEARLLAKKSFISSAAATPRDWISVASLCAEFLLAEHPRPAANELEVQMVPMPIHRTDQQLQRRLDANFVEWLINENSATTDFPHLQGRTQNWQMKPLVSASTLELFQSSNGTYGAELSIEEFNVALHVPGAISKASFLSETLDDSWESAELNQEPFESLVPLTLDLVAPNCLRISSNAGPLTEVGINSPKHASGVLGLMRLSSARIYVSFAVGGNGRSIAIADLEGEALRRYESAHSQSDGSRWLDSHETKDNPVLANIPRYSFDDLDRLGLVDLEDMPLDHQALIRDAWARRLAVFPVPRDRYVRLETTSEASFKFFEPKIVFGDPHSPPKYLFSKSLGDSWPSQFDLNELNEELTVDLFGERWEHPTFYTYAVACMSALVETLFAHNAEAACKHAVFRAFDIPQDSSNTVVAARLSDVFADDWAKESVEDNYIAIAMHCFQIELFDPLLSCPQTQEVFDSVFNWFYSSEKKATALYRQINVAEQIRFGPANRQEALPYWPTDAQDWILCAQLDRSFVTTANNGDDIDPMLIVTTQRPVLDRLVGCGLLVSESEDCDPTPGWTLTIIDDDWIRIDAGSQPVIELPLVGWESQQLTVDLWVSLVKEQKPVLFVLDTADRGAEDAGERVLGGRPGAHFAIIEVQKR